VLPKLITIKYNTSNGRISLAQKNAAALLNLALVAALIDFGCFEKNPDIDGVLTSADDGPAQE
jgi:hypothetical protein